MSKAYRQKTCAYCCQERSSETGDHVFAREFFPPSKRAGLPKVPACSRCNNEKSKLEHYLTSVLPFGGNHPDAAEVLAEMVPARLKKNAKLHRELSKGRSREWVMENGVVRPRMGVPIDAEKVAGLFELIARGLFLYHWKEPLPKSCNVRAGMLTPEGEVAFGQLLRMNGDRVSDQLGDGAFAYEGVRSRQDTHVTIWKFGVYGGLQMSGDPDAPTAIASNIWVTTSKSPSPLDLG